MADDIAALLKYLKIEKADINGLLAWRGRRPAQPPFSIPM